MNYTAEQIDEMIDRALAIDNLALAELLEELKRAKQIIAENGENMK